ncbi:MAG TPA: diguanylate cyclase [Thermoanaerobaculia bacterium]|nr:diguanylate cyclase [Thermoanaerobaculia bacterium]
MLVVDDDLAYLKLLQAVLTRAGFDVAVAEDGSAALEILSSDRDIGVAIIDLAMPKMDGIETIRRLQREDDAQQRLYTILHTSFDEVETRLRALEEGCDDFIPKSATSSEIVAKLRTAARRLEMERRLHIENKELQTLALTDELTAIPNRRALFRAATEMLARGRLLSAVLFDLDHFKQINDKFGHLEGDRRLVEVAAMLKTNTRVDDIIGRYGGDEFLLLLPDTEGREARAIANRLSRTSPITMSFGVATSSSSNDTLADLITACDERLYRYKNARRDGSEQHRARV